MFFSGNKSFCAYSLFAILLSFSVVGSSFAASVLDVGAEVRYNDNIGNAAVDDDKRSAFVASPTLVAGKYFQVADYTGIAMTADISGDIYSDHDNLNNALLGATVSLTHRFGLGPQAVKLTTFLYGCYNPYNDQYRTGYRVNSGLSVSRWFTERFKGEATYLYDSRMATDKAPPSTYGNVSSDVFSVSGHSGKVSGSYLLTDNGAINFSYTYRSGDVTSSAKPTKKVVLASKAITNDQALRRLAAYKLGAKSNILAIAYSHAIGNSSSLNLGYEFRDTLGDGNNNYQGTIIRFAYILSF